MKIYKTVIACCCCAAFLSVNGDSLIMSADSDISAPQTVPAAEVTQVGSADRNYGQFKREAKSMRKWKSGDLSIEIYGCGGDASYYCVNFGEDNCRYFAAGAPVCLLMVNGSFYNCGGITVIGDEAFVTASVLCSAVNVDFASSPSAFRISRGDTEITYSFGSAIFNVRANGRETAVAVATAPYIDGGEIMLPVSKVMEPFGYFVNIDRKNFGRAAVNTVIIEHAEPSPISREYGAFDVRQTALEMYAAIGQRLAEDNFPPAALALVSSDAAKLEIINGGDAYGRYYIYHIAGFEYLNIYYDKYSGAIFSDAVYTLPFLSIKPGVADLSQIYIQDWEKLCG